ncbi:IS110 family transposase [Butyricicoccus sp.]|uniref:IS110 family transposase n=1 Tax=Butyricicoccus sp. TaxID=2049021 RepID=UPI003AAA514F
MKAGLEATGHYSCSILGFLLNKSLHTCVINPLHTNLYRKSLSLRKTKTQLIDKPRQIAKAGFRCSEKQKITKN